MQTITPSLIGQFVGFTYSGGTYQQAMRIVLITSVSNLWFKGFDLTRNSWRSFSTEKVTNLRAFPTTVIAKITVDALPFSAEELAKKYKEEGTKTAVVSDGAVYLL